MNDRYRSKVVEIQAWRWMNKSEQNPAPTWMADALNKWPDVGGLAVEPDHRDGARICIATLEGVEVATPGYWIIKGLEGEIYPCKDSDFLAKYEPVEEEEL